MTLACALSFSFFPSTFDTASYMCVDFVLCVFFSSVFFSVVKAVAVSARTHNLTSSTLDRWIFGVNISFVRSLSLSLALVLHVLCAHCVYRIENTNTRKTEPSTKTIFSCIFVQFLQYLRLLDGVLFSLLLYRFTALP